MDDNKILAQLFKSEYRKIVSVLCKLFGLQYIQEAEDIVNDTFLLASETWRKNGSPDNPSSWLYKVAKNKTIDHLRRQKVGMIKIQPFWKKENETIETIEIDLSPKNINDSQLQMMFALCHPAVPKEAQIGLALRILCGIGIEEIAQAFLTNKETINKRLLRAKEKLKKLEIKLELPDAPEIEDRLDAVLITLYLLFNEGYHSSTQQAHIRKELCLEAMRLNYFLLENAATNKPKVNALMALMCYHSSRFDARTNEKGEILLYEEQDRSLWDEALIDKGNHYLIQSAAGAELSKYHLEASIAYWHTTKLHNPMKWENILQNYNLLLQIEYSPIAALNRTFAYAKVVGDEQALKEALKLDLKENHFYHALLGQLYVSLDVLKAVKHFEMAYSLAKTSSDKLTIEKQLAKVKS